MKTEQDKRLSALSYIIADVKAENIELEQRVHNLTADYNEIVRQLLGEEKRNGEDNAKQTLGEMQQMRDRCDKLERENVELERFVKAIYSFVKDKKLYMKKGANCPYYQDEPHVCSTFCLECDSCLGIIDGCGVICQQLLLELKFDSVK